MQNQIYSGLLRRILATIIDSIILIIPHAIVFGVSNIDNISSISSISNGGDIDDVKVHTFSYYLVSILINALYIGLFESSKFQGTIGKMALSIKIVNVDNQTISFSRSVFRYFILCLLSFVGVFIVNFFTILFTKEKVAVQDMLFETRVLVKNN
jgi:uncharacterized RDD family membrane protein YckC